MRRFPFPLLLVSLLLSACGPASPGASTRALADTPWAYADLRALQAGDAASPATSLIALYTRQDSNDLQIRLDLLDSASSSDCDLYVALDTQAGGSQRLPIQAASSLAWDELLVLPAQAPPRVLTPDGSAGPHLRLQVTRDPLQDTLVITLDPSGLPAAGPFRVEAWSTLPGKLAPAGHLGPVPSDAAPPPRARLLLAFWDTLPAFTPAQTLRRWDGAHTGPLGQRHGLFPLLSAAGQYHIPLALLDLKTPASLAALDYLGGLSLVKSLVESGLLLLPAVAYGDPATDQGLAFGREAALAFGLPDSPFLYGSAASGASALPSGTRAIFASLAPNDHLVRWKDARLIPLPATGSDTEATSAGPSLPVRTQLLQAALSGDPSRLVVLGGDLAHSVWGDATIAGPALAYIENHPWIHALDGYDLLTAPLCSSAVCPPAQARPCADFLCIPPAADAPLYTSQGTPLANGLTSNALRARLLAGLAQSPPGPVTDLAWRTYLMLTDPLSDPALQALRDGYLGQVGSLLAAARWAAQPADLSSCQTDPDLDGQPECTLANQDFFFLFETDGARLAFAFVRTAHGVAQWIGPASQLVVGLSDPSLWNPARGPAGDPADIPGAFSDPSDLWAPYRVASAPGELVFTSPDGSRQKTFTLTPDGLRVDYRWPGPIQTQIPLAVAANERFLPGWAAAYTLGNAAEGLTWGLSSLPKVAIRTSAQVTLQTFKDSSAAMQRPEDPNLGYPPGHYLPYPLALVTLAAQDSLTVLLNVAR